MLKISTRNLAVNCVIITKLPIVPHKAIFTFLELRHTVPLIYTNVTLA